VQADILFGGLIQISQLQLSQPGLATHFMENKLSLAVFCAVEDHVGIFHHEASTLTRRAPFNNCCVRACSENQPLVRIGNSFNFCAQYVVWHRSPY
jgi:hypothetical protein